MIRENIYGELVPAYFNIDSIKIQLELLREIYSNPENLKESLRIRNYNVNFSTENYEDAEITEQDESEINEELRLLEREELIEQLRQCEEENRAELAGRIKVRASFNGTIFIDRLLDLIEYVPFNELVDRLGNRMSYREYKTFYNSVIYGR